MISCSFIFVTGCSTLGNWFGFDSPDRQANDNVFSKNHLDTFISSVRPINGNAESDYRLARYFQKRGKHKFAVDELLKAVSKDPSYAKAYNALGVSYDKLGQFDLAAKSYKFALKINPGLDYVYNNLGYSYLLHGNFDAAIEAFQKAIALNDTHKRYHNNLGLAYARKGQTHMAAVEFNLAKNDSSNRTNPERRFKDQIPSLESKAAVETLPEGITPYDDISKDNEVPLLLAGTAGLVSEGDPEFRLVPDDVAGIDPQEDTSKNEVKPSNSTQKTVAEVRNPERYTVQVSASENLMRATRLIDIEISNGNGVRHMARNVGFYLKAKGFIATRLTNADHFNYPETKIYYRKGYRQDALRLAEDIPGRQKQANIIEMRRTKKRAIKVLIGKDLIPFHAEIKGNLKSRIAKEKNAVPAKQKKVS